MKEIKFFSEIIKNKELVSNIVGSVLIKGLSMIISFLTLSAYLSYFTHQEVLGVWLVLVSILTWILTFDLGVGNGLRNYLVISIVEKNSIDAKKYISSAYIIIGGISIILLFGGLYFIRLFNWNSILNIDISIISELLLINVVSIVYISIVMQFFFKLIQSILNALQKTALANFLSLFSHICIFAFVMLSDEINLEQSILNLAIIYMLATNLPLIIASIIVFSTSLKKSRPNLKFWSKNFANKVMKLGYMFFWIQITLLVINLTNEFLITQLYSPSDVIEYQIYNRFFIIFLTVFSIITIPIWSAVTQAFNEKRYSWVLKIYRYLNIGSLVLIIILFLSAPFFQLIVDIWLQENSIRVDRFKILLFIIFYALMIFIYSVTCIANGIGELKTQLITNTFAAIVKIPLVIYLSQYIESWTIIVLVNIVIMLPSAIIQPIILKRHIKTKML